MCLITKANKKLKGDTKLMEFVIKAKDSALPCIVTIDEDNGRYMLRNIDTSGEVFSNKEHLLNWIQNEWHAELFEDESAYYDLLEMVKGFDTFFNEGMINER